METASGMEKSYAKVNVHNQTSGFAYWQAQPYQVRLATLGQIRQEYHRWRYGAELKKSKKAAGRLQDLADLENLE